MVIVAEPQLPYILREVLVIQRRSKSIGKPPLFLVFQRFGNAFSQPSSERMVHAPKFEILSADDRNRLNRRWNFDRLQAYSYDDRHTQVPRAMPDDD